jgi:hypothetical protein
VNQGRDKSFRRAMTVVAIIVVVLLAAAAGTLLYLRATTRGGGVASSLGIGDGSDASRVVLVIASSGADGSVVAQLVALVDSRASQDASTAISDIDPDTRVAIPGTSFDRLRDTYAFGGGAAVAAALPKPRPAYVAVPQVVWTAAVDRSGGVTVTLPASLEVFDGSRLTSFAVGAQHLTGDGIAALLLGLSYVPAAERPDVRRQLEIGIASSLAADPSDAQAGVTSDLSPQTLRTWLSGSRLKSGGR